MNTNAFTVFVVDDDPSIRKSLSRLLRTADWNVETFGGCDEFLHRYDPEAPGCLVLDLALPDFNGLELQHRLAMLGSLLPIVFLSGHGDIPTSVKAVKAGAVDFLTKPVSEEALFRALQEAVDQDRSMRRQQAQLTTLQARFATLTPRERDVLYGVVTGKRNKQIAAELGTVEKTIKVHRGRVMAKMNAHSLADLVQLAARLGMTSKAPADTLD